MVACWNYTAGYNVFETGAKLEDIVDETFLFMPNHQVSTKGMTSAKISVQGDPSGCGTQFVEIKFKVQPQCKAKLLL